MKRKEEVVATAAQVFKTKGYYSASLQDLADELGLLKGSLYYYIDSKEDLLLEIISGPMSVIQAKLRNLISSPMSSREKLLQAMRDHMELYETHFYEVCVFFDIISHPPDGIRDSLRAMMREQQALWERIVVEGIETGQFRKDLDPKMATFAILGMCTWAYQWIRTDGRLSMREIAAIFGDMVLEGIT